MENKFDAVGIYKIPPLWDQYTLKLKPTSSLTYNICDNHKNFNEHTNRKTSIEDNIYLLIFIKLVKKFNFKKTHFIFVDQSLENNLNFKLNDINVWILKDIESVLYFNNSKFYFLRGNYHNFYEKLIPKYAYTIFYPGTSIKFDYNIKKGEKIKKKNLEVIKKFKPHPVYKKYDLVLVHENEIYQKMFNNTILFEKIASPSYYFLNMDRIFDFIFVADATQSTKNHEIMFDLINFCENRKYPINFCYVSDKEILKKKYTQFCDKFNYVKVNFVKNLNPDQLNIFFNLSKINLCFSGRDAAPRTILESMACGCFNLCLDTLSDGKYFYHGIFGKILSHSNSLVINDNYSIRYIPNNELLFNILNFSYKEINHEKIALESQKKYNLDNLMQKIETKKKYTYHNLTQKINDEIDPTEYKNEKDNNYKNEIL
jgi:hypothetical protein